MPDDSNAAPVQQPLFLIPTEVRWCQPRNLGSADAGQICQGMDGCAYVIKDATTGASTPLTPHCEWFCTRLGELVGIASPTCKVIRLPDGTMVFGSRWEGGVVAATPATPAGNWWDRVAAGTIKLDDLAGPLSRIYAFDHFIYNEDRHTRNFIVRDQLDGHVIMAMDYSRAWIRHGMPLPALPMKNSIVSTQQQLAVQWGRRYIDQTEVKSLVDAVKNVTARQAEQIINDHPKEWLPDDMRNAILSWWGSPLMMSRLDGIINGVADGTYL